jgi:hypothetical protein
VAIVDWNEQMQPDATTHSRRTAHSGPGRDRWATPRHELSSWIDRRVLDVTGDGIGVIVDIYCDATTARPTWLAIDIGGSPPIIAVIPVRGSSLLGENVILANDRATVLAEADLIRG